MLQKRRGTGSGKGAIFPSGIGRQHPDGAGTSGRPCGSGRLAAAGAGRQRCSLLCRLPGSDRLANQVGGFLSAPLPALRFSASWRGRKALRIVAGVETPRGSFTIGRSLVAGRAPLETPALVGHRLVLV